MGLSLVEDGEDVRDDADADDDARSMLTVVPHELETVEEEEEQCVEDIERNHQPDRREGRRREEKTS